jgi:hypothetical protein
LSRDGVFQAKLKQPIKTQMGQSKGSKYQQWWLYALIGTAVLALAAYMLQPYIS